MVRERMRDTFTNGSARDRAPGLAPGTRGIHSAPHGGTPPEDRAAPPPHDAGE